MVTLVIFVFFVDLLITPVSYHNLPNTGLFLYLLYHGAPSEALPSLFSNPELHVDHMSIISQRHSQVA